MLFILFTDYWQQIKLHTKYPSWAIMAEMGITPAQAESASV